MKTESTFRARRWAHLIVPSVCFAVSASAVLAAVVFGRAHVAVDRHDPILNFLLRWDGVWYYTIAEQGYSYATDEMSSAVFFPAYPLIGQAVSEATGMHTGWALVLVSNVFAWGSFVLLYLYAKAVAARWWPGESRDGDAAGVAVAAAMRPRVAELSVVVAAFAPISYFFHIGYSESTFLFFALLSFVLMSRGVHPLVVALAVAVATASRPVGVALLPALAIYAIQRASAARPVAPASRRWRAALGAAPGGSRWRRWLAACASVALGAAGLLAFMVYLEAEFGTATAFASAGEPWRTRPSPPLGEKIWLLAGLAPVRQNLDLSGSGILSPGSLNALAFLAAAGLVAFGAARRWLTWPEALAAAGFLLIPYWSLGIEREMNAMARYSLVVFPIYPVVARMLVRLSTSVVASLAAGSCVLMVLRTAMFTSHQSAHSVVESLF